MILEEAIKHCEEVAEEQKEKAKEGRLQFETWDYISKCEECASEHRQLADWLKVLKEIWNSGDCNDCLHQHNCTIRPQPGKLVRFNCYQYERRGELGVIGIMTVIFQKLDGKEKKDGK